jgi:glycerol uptake facilitator protein
MRTLMKEIIVSEFFGTCLLMLLGNGVVANVLLKQTKGHNSGWIVISAGWGFAVGIAVYAGWLSGAHFNPAVTFGFALIGKTDWNLVPIYWISQLLGAIAGQLLVWAAYFSHWSVTPDTNLKLLCFSTKPAIRKNSLNFLTETIATAVLLFGILIIYDPHNEMTKALGPYLVGILIFSIGLSLGGPTGFAINPARDLGPRILHSWLPLGKKGTSHWDYAWIPTLGPIVGAAIGALLYRFFFLELLRF